MATRKATTRKGRSASAAMLAHIWRTANDRTVKSRLQIEAHLEILVEIWRLPHGDDPETLRSHAPTLMRFVRVVFEGEGEGDDEVTRRLASGTTRVLAACITKDYLEAYLDELTKREPARAPELSALKVLIESGMRLAATTQSLDFIDAYAQELLWGAQA